MKFSIFFFIIGLTIVTGQNKNNKTTLIVDYSHSLNIEGSPSVTTVNARLVANQFKSVYEMDFLNLLDFQEEESNEDGTVLKVKPSHNPKIFKDFKSKSIYSIERIFMDPYYVKDSYNIFQWKLENEFKVILGYKCQKATLNYRGRNYESYFTTEIHFNTGPWKFAGLPGLMLEIKSTDGAFEIEANKVQIKTVPLEIENPFKNKIETFISWDDFLNKYKRKYDEFESYSDPEGGTMSIPKRKIEVLIED